MSLMKEARTESGVRQCSRTVPVKDEPFTAAATASIVDGLPEQQELAGDKTRHERPEGVRSSQMDLSHSPGHPPGEIVTKHRSGWSLG